MKDKYCVVMTTYSDALVGQKIIDSLIKKQLAACIQKQSISSYYCWNGKVNHDDETLILIKTKTSVYKDVERCIIDNHSYDVPEIIQLPITTGYSAYLKWIDEQCK